MNDPRVPDPRMISPWTAPSQSGPAEGGPGPTRRGPPQSSQLEDGALIRPYLVTGGRTRPLQDGLRVETVVHAAPAALHAPLKFERRRIVELCQTPRAVAEIAVALAIPLGVARVLVADLVTGAFLAIQETPVTTDMIERIRDRVRAL